METRRLSVLSLIFIVGLAGCSGMAPFGESENVTDTHDLSYPDGYNESGITDPETAVNQHKSVLRDSESLTLKLNATAQFSVLNGSLRFHAEQNTTSERGMLSMAGMVENNTFMEESEYNSNGTTYVMNKTEEEPVQYEAYQESFGSQPTFDEGYVSEWLTNATVGEPTQITHNGEQVFRYEVTDAAAAEPFGLDIDDNITLNDLNGTMLVDENGIVRSFSYTMNYTTADGTDKMLSADYRISDLNATTVEEPDWVETAKEQV
ncbi:DUF7537 family lipoprotein [Halocatena salina]|uniref:Uncharacterized protein n=1 Tax=Halocatena salina TaxID=2934340 RepID=A0A8T9ZZA8_9EURY|nr:hypothetical protein [Halocatena salina]UPM41779.1 hypothetical protein MW046_07200 [Halocatena salina]